MDELIRSNDDVLRMLDALLGDEGEHWDGFYADRGRPIPFFVNAPDESLVEWFQSGKVSAGRVLELGCGPGRNAIYMAKQGCEVDAVDVSEVSLDWARERAVEQGLSISFERKSIFELDVQTGCYDLVYDAGCFHHIPPHRRASYLSLLERALKPNGLFGLVCMTGDHELGGEVIPDSEVYRRWSMRGGLGYSQDRIREVFGGTFDVLELRRMRRIEQPAEVFGEDFLWAGLFRKTD